MRSVSVAIMVLGLLLLATCSNDNPTSPPDEKPVNHAPRLVSVESHHVTVGDTLTLTITATDPDSDAISLECLNAPINATFLDSANGRGLFTFAPADSQIAAYQVGFAASDGELADTMQVPLIVAALPNQPPQIEPQDTITAVVGQTAHLEIHATDPDGNQPNITAVQLPNNARLTPGQGKADFYFTPNDSQVGEHHALIVAWDGELSDTLDLTIIVIAHQNQPPEIQPLKPDSVRVGEQLQLVITATDPEGVLPSFGFPDLPANAYHTMSNGAVVFIFQPDESQIGEVVVTVTAWDGELKDTAYLHITVLPLNLPPQFYDVPTQYIEVGNRLILAVVAIDLDDDVITLTAPDIPANSEFTDLGQGNGFFSFTPDFSQAGFMQVAFIAADGCLADTLNVLIAVSLDTSAIVQNGVFPCAVGNSWTYAYEDVTTYDTIEVSIVGLEVVDNEIWWLLSEPLGPLRDRFVVRHGAIYSEHGLELVGILDSEVEFAAPPLDTYCGTTSGPRTASEGSDGVIKHTRRHEPENYWGASAERIDLNPEIGLTSVEAYFEYQLEGAWCTFELIGYNIKGPE